MDLFSVLAAVLTLTAGFSFLNHRTLKLPTTIGVMVMALAWSLAVLALHYFGLADLEEWTERVLASIDFNEAVLGGMLAFLLFAGALHVDLGALREQAKLIGLLATVGVVLSTFLVGAMSYGVSWSMGLGLRWIDCLLFGALISPTDPIAVLALLKKAGVPKSLEVKITGESLFNDGVGVVVFLVLLEIAVGGADVSAGHIAGLFAQEAIGGAVYGLLVGGVAFAMLRKVDSYQVEVLITLALVAGSYALAMALHLSGPIAIVVAGLLIGNHGRRLAMTPSTREHLDAFWELVDELLNAVLFVLIGLEVLVLTVTGETFGFGLIAIAIVLVARFVAVGGAVTLLSRVREFSKGVVPILTWGGLRGGISVALALAIPKDHPHRDLILTATYVVVLFSIVVQGLSVGALVRRLSPR